MTGQALWQADAAAQATGGQMKGNWSQGHADITGISIDTRSLVAGDLFIALQGPKFDGHDYVAQAFEKGAAAAMVHRTIEGLENDAALLMVDDTLGALWRLGAAGRERSKARFIAVTGSVGKTSTKEALKNCLSAQAPTAASPGSLNNHWGVPLSLARMDQNATYGVFELGMNNPGEILELARLVRPQIGLITNVEAAHLGNFESIGAIADAKSELFQAMDRDGVAVLNRDHPLFHHLRDKAELAGVTKLITFGQHQDSTIRLLNHTLELDGSSVEADVGGKEIHYHVGAPGWHWVTNSLAVLAASFAAGADAATAGRSLADLEALKGRGARHVIPYDSGSFTIIDESYNANPASMRAAISLLGQADPAANGRRVAVLGDMLELGPSSGYLHRKLSEPLREAEVDLVYCCGPEMEKLYRALPKRLQGGHCPNSQELAPMVIEGLEVNDVVLIKGSLGSRMAVILDALLNIEDTPPKAANGG
ncbi:MAG: UDP-N-acetylmuramoylalanyl-D-glutamyl-2,6-diaminopimelate--D-alanyl-D-alanine ligase [Pseudomonadota bacterium]